MLPQILNVMASPEHFPNECPGITAHQQDNTYVPYKLPADEPAEPRRRPKLPTMRGSTSANASFAPCRCTPERCHRASCEQGGLHTTTPLLGDVT